MRRVTESQQQTLNAVACLTLLHGRAPTMRELGQALGVSHVAASYRLRWLEKKGLWRGALSTVYESERRTLTALASLTLLHGHPPSRCNLGEALGCSPTNAYRRLRELTRKGLWDETRQALTPSGLREVRLSTQSHITQPGVSAALARTRPHRPHSGRASFRARRKTPVLS